MLARTLIMAAALSIGSDGRAAAPAIVATEPDLRALIEQLGDPDYAVRELASQKLMAAGASASDLLLAAAEESPNLEVALRARWLADSIPFGTGKETPEAAELLDAYPQADLAERVRIMHRLLRLDDDSGIEPLARIVRLERTAAGSRIAAALLVRDWEPGDPFWPGLADPVLAGIGTSSRPAARFLRGLVAHATADSPEAAAAGIEACLAATESMTDAHDFPGSRSGEDGLAGRGVALSGEVFRRCLVAMLAASGRRSEAVAVANTLLDSDDDSRLAAQLQWLADHGLPEAVDLVADRLADEPEPLLAYAAALAWQRRDAPEAATKARELSALAHHRLDGLDLEERLEAAITLSRWGGVEWSCREYEAILAAAETRPAERALAAISYSELLHDQEQDAAAAAVLEGILGAGGQQGEDLNQGLMQLGRDLRTIRSRMLFFRAFAAPDDATRRQLIDDSLRAYPDDVDSLIAAYRLAADDPDRRAEVVAQITRTAAGIDREIRELSSESGRRNEYAWLIANTEGDVAKATRYSRTTLEHDFDTASYLDTLAHCHAAAGRLDRALRTQWLAVKQEPHSLLIRRNLERFRTLAGVSP